VALAMNRGVPPTALKARTGLLTPPGISLSARSKSFVDFVIRMAGMSGDVRRSVAQAFQACPAARSKQG
jgi:hypothetical protein